MGMAKARTKNRQNNITYFLRAPLSNGKSSNEWYMEGGNKQRVASESLDIQWYFSIGTIELSFRLILDDLRA